MKGKWKRDASLIRLKNCQCSTNFQCIHSLDNDNSTLNFNTHASDDDHDKTNCSMDPLVFRSMFFFQNRKQQQQKPNKILGKKNCKVNEDWSLMKNKMKNKTEITRSCVQRSQVQKSIYVCAMLCALFYYWNKFCSVLPMKLSLSSHRFLVPSFRFCSISSCLIFRLVHAHRIASHRYARAQVHSRLAAECRRHWVRQQINAINVSTSLVRIATMYWLGLVVTQSRLMSWSYGQFANWEMSVIRLNLNATSCTH